VGQAFQPAPSAWDFGRIRAYANVEIAQRSTEAGVPGLFIIFRIHACGNVGIAPRDFQGRWEECKTRLGFCTLSTARHFHRLRPKTGD
jgi:hypothetical protein